MFWDAQIWNFEALNWIMLGKWKHQMIFEEQSSSCTSDCNDEWKGIYVKFSCMMRREWVIWGEIVMIRLVKTMLVRVISLHTPADQ